MFETSARVALPDSEYLRFEDETPIGRKTRVIRIVSRRWNDTLGFIRWYGAWRQYVFQPEDGTTWNPACLSTVNDTIGLLTAERRERNAS